MVRSLSHFLDERHRAGTVPPQVASLIERVAGACSEIAAAVRYGAITGTMGSLDRENVQGEVQKQLDVIANDIMLQATATGGELQALASEEMDTIHAVPDHAARGDYLLVFDPIDGSSNIDVNGVVGTIFSVLKAPDLGGIEVGEADFFQPGAAQVAAGYAIYGPQTLLVLTLGAGVQIFAFEGARRQWVLIEPRVSIPTTTREYAINTAHHRFWHPPVARYVSELVAGESGPRQANFNMRWMASMVGDVHRILTRGGVFLYPADTRQNMAAGKLRLLYEANPMALIIEQAGGLATTGTQRILDVPPQALHQRVPVILGSAHEVTFISHYHRTHDAG